MKLTVLGSSSALPTSKRYPSAHVLGSHERLFLIDCGEGTQMQLRKCRIKIARINDIFISHLHGDHVFGLYGLLSSYNLMGREYPLNLYAPENYQHILHSHLEDFDINLRFEIRFFPLRGKEIVKIMDDKHLSVYAFPLKHRVETFGFLFREKTPDKNIRKECISNYEIPISAIPSIKKGADFIKEDGTVIKNEELTIPPQPPLSYAYCSDTAYFKRLAEFVKGVTLLYHEATFDKSLSELAREVLHSTTADAASVAKEAGAENLMIGHFSSRYDDICPLVEETREMFPLTIPAIDGKTYDLSNLENSWCKKNED